jgi:energy-coupling factor transport system substrate-specific component
MPDGIITNGSLTIENLQAAGAETNGTAGNPRFLNPVTTDFQPGRGSDAEGKGDAKYLPASDMLGMIGSISYAGAYVPVNRTYYYVSNSGNNSGTGSDTDPFATISYALGVMAPGDYLYIKAGTYDEAVSISEKDSLVLKNYQKEQPVINGGITVQDSQNITVSGFTSTKAVKIAGGKNIKVLKMDVNEASVIVVPGAGNSSTDGYEISSSFIHGFQGEGALLVYNGKNGAIINNVIYGLTADPVSFVYAITSIAIGVAVGIMAYKGWVDNIGKAIVTGLVVALVAAIVSTPINIGFWGGQTGNVWGDALYAFLTKNGFPTFIASFLDELVVDLPDKVATVIISFLIFKGLPKKLTVLYNNNDVIEKL